MRILCNYLLVVVCLTQVGCDSSSSTAKDDSPQAAFDGYSQAYKGGDWKTLADTLTPESQDILATRLLFRAGMIAASDASKDEELGQLFERHGLSGRDLTVEIPVKNKPAFIGEVGSWLSSQEGNSTEIGFPLGNLGNLQIDGDSATGNVNGESISFQRVNGGWLVDLETPESKINDVSLSPDLLQGKFLGEPWIFQSVVRGPTGGLDLLGEPQDGSSKILHGAHIILGDRWLPLESGPGRLGFSRNLVFHVPPSSNTVCSTGKYEISETDDSWILLLYAIEDDDTFVNGKVVIPKTLLAE